jgi:hypothetical protein
MRSILGQSEELYACFSYGEDWVKGKDKRHAGIAITNRRIVLYDPGERGFGMQSARSPGYRSIPYRQVTALHLLVEEDDRHPSRPDSFLNLTAAFMGVVEGSVPTNSHTFHLQFRGRETAVDLQNLIMSYLV